MTGNKKTTTAAQLPARNIQVTRTSGVTWINVFRPTTNALQALQRHLPFLLDLDLQDCLPPFQRPKMLERPDYLFMVLLYPLYDPDTRTVRPVEVDFFIGTDFVVTSQAEPMPLLSDLTDACLEDKRLMRKRLGKTPAEVLSNLLHELLVSVFPLLTHMSNDILKAEREMFNQTGHETAQNILRIKSNIVQCRQAMQGHKTVLRKFLSRSPGLLNLKGLDLRFEDLVGHTKEIWDYLENDRDTIDAVYDSHTSLITNSTSLASQRLAALALIIFPTTLVAAIFAMGADHMPIRGNPYDFWIMLGLVMATMAGTVTLLRWKKWL
ncbi:MAG: CorA family divalent cation transporter [bacterium]